jgi:iron complex outermembrane receptor protein
MKENRLIRLSSRTFSRLTGRLSLMAALALSLNSAPGQNAAAPPATANPAQEGVLPETVISGEGKPLLETSYIIDSAPAALKLDVPLVEIPRSVAVISRQQFEDRGVLTVQDALLYTPGVYGATYGFDTRGDWALVRGVDPLDYLNGLKSTFDYYNNTRPHPYSLSSVEIVKGPASVLFGQSSLGGIVNATTKLPLTRPYNEVFLSYGSHDRLEAGFDLGGKAGETLTWRLVAGNRDSGSQVDHVTDDTWFISPSVSWTPDDDTTLTLLANFQQAETGTSAQFAPWQGTILPGRRIPSNRFISEPGFDRYDTEQASVTAIFEHQFDEVFRLEARGRYTDSAADYGSIWPSFPPTIDGEGYIDRTLYVSDATSESFVFDVRMRAEFETGEVSHNASLGVDYQHAVTDNDSYYSGLGGGRLNIYAPRYGGPLDLGPVVDYASTTFEQVGIYLNDRIEIADQWIVSFGGRYDDLTSVAADGAFDDQADALTFDAGLMYQLGNGVAPYLSYAESFLPVSGTDINNQPYDPREGRQYEAGVKYQPEGTDYLFTLAYFDIVEQNRLTASPSGAGSEQTGEVGIQGVELEAMTKWNDFYFQAGYSYVDATITASNDGDQGFHVASVPENQFMTWVTWRPSIDAMEGFKAGIGLRYVGDSWDGLDTIRTPAYTLIDAMVGYEKGPWDFTLNVTNLEDEEHITTALARGDAFFGQQRFVGATLRYRF